MWESIFHDEKIIGLPIIIVDCIVFLLYLQLCALFGSRMNGDARRANSSLF